MYSLVVICFIPVLPHGYFKPYYTTFDIFTNYKGFFARLTRYWCVFFWPAKKEVDE
jgi:hypothetical protein